MSAISSQPGAAPVGRLTDLPPLERRIVRSLRLLGHGEVGRAALQMDLAAALGPETAAAVGGRLEELLGTLMRHARRPVACHDLTCPCVGGDEYALARFVALAAEGDREDATLLAALLVRADVAICLAPLAEEVGLRVGRIAFEAVPPANGLH
jgi:hypothetical protein